MEMCKPEEDVLERYVNRNLYSVMNGRYKRWYINESISHTTSTYEIVSMGLYDVDLMELALGIL